MDQKSLKVKIFLNFYGAYIKVCNDALLCTTTENIYKKTVIPPF